MKKIVFQQWNLMRWVRLGLGIAIIVQAATVKDWTVIILGGMFTGMAIFNVGCCGTGGCSTASKKTSTQQQKEVFYEEVD